MSSSSPSTHDAHTLEQAHSTLYAAGLEMRNKVAGKEYVDQALKNATSDFARPMQEKQHGPVSGPHPGLDLKTRSLLNIAMLCALNRGPKLAVLTRGALNNGASDIEIRETILQAAVYAGMPAGMEGIKIAKKAIGEWKGESNKEKQ